MFSLLSLLDDIATTLDDVALMSKLAIKKTSALMSDDLAVNAGVIDGVEPNRELPMVKAIFWGSLLNKVYCISGVLLFMKVFPPAITFVMFLGGLYLSYEGVHKIIEKLFHKKKAKEEGRSSKVITEEEKVRGAVRTDLILSIEIIVIAKSTLSGPFLTQLLVLIAVGLLASVLIYGLVALIVKIDDLGLYLLKKGSSSVGSFLVRSMPYTMKILGVVGTVAMLLVGGGIVAHIFHLPYYLNEHLQNLSLGFIVGLLVLLFVTLGSKIFKKKSD